MSNVLKNRVGYLSGAPRISTLPEAAVSGPRTRVLGIVKGFEALGWKVNSFIAGDRVPRKWVTEESEPAVNSKPWKIFLIDLVRLGLNFVNARKAWNELNGKVDLVYEYNAALGSLGWIFKEYEIPWIVETHRPLFYEVEAERQNVFLKKLARERELKAYRDCDLIVTITEALKDILVREGGIPAQKVLVVPSSVDTDKFNPELAKPKRFFDGFTIGFVGNLYVWQRLDFLIEVLRELRDEGLDISLTVVGSGQMQKEWMAKALDLELAGNVKFVGQVPGDAVPDYIAGFDIGYSGHQQLQIGTMYHSPLKIYEYMAMETPVVASAFADAIEVIKDGETGFLFQSGDKEDLKAALRKAYAKRELLPEIGRKAREEIIANYSWNARVEMMLEKIQNLHVN